MNDTVPCVWIDGNLDKVDIRNQRNPQYTLPSNTPCDRKRIYKPPPAEEYTQRGGTGGKVDVLVN